MNVYTRVLDLKIYVMAPISVLNYIWINCTTVTGQTIQGSDQLNMNGWE